MDVYVCCTLLLKYEMDYISSMTGFLYIGFSRKTEFFSCSILDNCVRVRLHVAIKMTKICKNLKHKETDYYSKYSLIILFPNLL